MIGIGKIVVGVLAVTTVTVGIGSVVGPPSDRAVVARVVDGDTFEATLGGRTTSIRLLNVDTPETKDPNADVECLGPEAAARLARMLPVGSTVELAFDDERLDRYGRTLAGVYDAQDRLVNAELAREGLGTAVVVGSNDLFYGEVLAAQQEARTAGRGLYAPTVACTVPARVQDMTTAVAAAQGRTQLPPSAPAELDRAAQEAAELAGDIARLRTAFTGPRLGHVWTALSPDDDRRLSEALSTAHRDATGLNVRFAALARTARETERRAAEQAERERVVREQQARAAGQAAREAEQAARQAEDRRRRESTPPPATQPAAVDDAAGSGCDPNYSPCVPVSASDLDCPDLPGGPYTVIGSDRHRLDNGDPDNLGCE